MLEPCEPIERILEAVSKLDNGERLKVLHRREPRLLYPMLEKLGYAWHCEQQAEARYIILIWRPHDKPSEEAGRSDSSSSAT